MFESLFKEKAIPRMRSLYFILKTTRNWLEVLQVRYAGKAECVARFRNGYELKVSRKNWQRYILHTHLFSLLPSAKLKSDSLTFSYQGRNLTFNFGKYGFDTVFEVFAFDPYRDFLKFANPAGKKVIDVGAAFGDTAIYFLLKGASHVVAVEAFPGYYSLAKQNIEINGFQKQCEVLLAAGGGNSGGSLIIDTGLEDMFGANMKQTDAGQTVPIITLQELADKYQIVDGFLKLDTEGFEYEILLNTPREVLRRFSDMLIEYHYGYERLEAYLRECGYTFFHTGPTHVFMPHLIGEEAQNMYTGHIVAKRVD
jgi:FkbM family methyltransferase